MKEVINQSDYKGETNMEDLKGKGPENMEVSISGSNMERHQSKEDEMEGRR